VAAVGAIGLGVTVAVALQSASAQDGCPPTTTTTSPPVDISGSSPTTTVPCPTETAPPTQTVTTGTTPVIPLAPSFADGEVCRQGLDLADLPPPVLGELINVQWISGEPLKITTPDGESFCLTGGAVQISVGSVIDARDSKVQVITEGSTREASFFDGLFEVLQSDEEHAATVLKLIGPLENCDEASADKPGGRQLWGEGEGEHRTDGNLAAATVRGTKWLLQDRCNGTTFAKVVEGIVTLRDLAEKKTVELEAGETYTAGP
jgi:hypothetical protein